MPLEMERIVLMRSIRVLYFRLSLLQHPPGIMQGAVIVPLRPAVIDGEEASVGKLHRAGITVIPHAAGIVYDILRIPGLSKVMGDEGMLSVGLGAITKGARQRSRSRRKDLRA